MRNAKLSEQKVAQQKRMSAKMVKIFLQKPVQK